MANEFTAKKVDDAIKLGLAQLGASLDEVKVEVLDQGGLFRKAKVRLTLEREEEPKKEEIAPEKIQKKPEPPTEKKPEPKHTEKQKSAEKVEPKPEKKPTEKVEHSAEKKTESKKAHSADKVKNAEAGEVAESHPAKTSEETKQAIARATEFIAELVKKMGFTEATVEAQENGDVAITAPDGDDSLIIGRHGETLSAISFLAETLGRAEKQHVNIVADCNGYRGRRAASLTAMAKRRAGEAVAKHRKIKLEPMERVDRRTIHNALGDDDRVTTASEGKEPYRYIVIIPKK
ncbi:MAG: Jag N-terminal domain-containing protein [Clostridiales bacterium]|nr:Jag N-terminal domain-containing protein [Clostridiales bacterium]